MRINEAVGRFLRMWREGHGLTLDDVATASRRYGTNWIAATVRNIERGGGRASELSVLLVLTRTLNDLAGDDMSLADLFARCAGMGIEGPFELTNAFSVSIPDLVDALDGQELPPPTDAGFLEAHLDGLVGSARRMLPPRPDDKERAEAMLRHVPTAAEVHAAARIDVPPEVFGAWCIYLYGVSLDDEARRRAGDGATPQRRGKFTRTITGEVEKAVEENAKKRAHVAIKTVGDHSGKVDTF